jgi:hypothetical protein
MDWQVTRYRHPTIFVQHTGSEIVEFPVSNDGTVKHNGRFDLGDARRAAISGGKRFRATTFHLERGPNDDPIKRGTTETWPR